MTEVYFRDHAFNKTLYLHSSISHPRFIFVTTQQQQQQELLNTFSLEISLNEEEEKLFPLLDLVEVLGKMWTFVILECHRASWDLIVDDMVGRFGWPPLRWSPLDIRSLAAHGSHKNSSQLHENDERSERRKSKKKFNTRKVFFIFLIFCEKWKWKFRVLSVAKNRWGKSAPGLSGEAKNWRIILSETSTKELKLKISTHESRLAGEEREARLEHNRGIPIKRESIEVKVLRGDNEKRLKLNRQKKPQNNNQTVSERRKLYETENLFKD